MDQGAILGVTGLSKSFRVAGSRLEVLRGIDLTLNEGEILAIVGQSGSGKSTLLHQIGLLDACDEGEIRFRGERLPLTGAQAAYARNRVFGFIFQFYHLLPEFTAFENVLMPALILEGWGTYRRQRKQLKARAAELLDRVGLSARMKHRPPELSGGERQRVAIARALMNEPAILLCDEPTGNLDRHTSRSIRELLWDLNRTDNQSMILVTHDPGMAGEAHRTLDLVDGRLGAPMESP